MFGLFELGSIAASAYAADRNADAAQASNQQNAELFHYGNAFNAEQATTAWLRSEMSAEANRDFQWKMSSTAHEREMNDLKRAGLNPILGAAKGAAMASGGQGQAHAASSVTPPKMENVFSQGLTAGLQMANAMVVNENTRMDTQLKKAQIARETASAGNLEQQTVKIQVEIPKLQAEARLLYAQEGTELYKQTVLRVEEQLKRTQEALDHKRIDLVEAEIAFTKAKTILSKLAEPEAQNAANAQDSWWMRNVSPYLPDLLKSSGAASTIRGLGR